MTYLPRRTLIVDDDSNSAQLARSLLRDSYAVDRVSSAEEALLSMTKHYYSLIISEVVLPGMSGLKLLQVLRAGGDNIPFIILSGLKSEEAILAGYQQGCDVYITKPANLPIVIAQVRALLSRCDLQVRSAATKQHLTYTLGPLRIIGEEEVYIYDKKIDLYYHELMILLVLWQHRDKYLTRRELCRMIGSTTYNKADNVTTAICRIRRCFGEEGRRLIHTCRGRGYKLAWEGD